MAKKKSNVMGRPTIPKHLKKQKVNVALDPEVKAHADRYENRSTFINDCLREAIGEKTLAKEARNLAKREGT